jgi:hypothetical protein
MHSRKIPGLAWSSEDEAVYRKWCRATCMFYGCVGLILIAAWGVSRLASDDQRSAAPIDHSPSMASNILEPVRR